MQSKTAIRWLWPLLSLSALLTLPASEAALPRDFVVEPVLTGLSFPFNLAFASDGRIFYNELRSGKIRVVKNGQLLAEPFYKLDIVNDGEQGLLGIALAPGFPDPPYVYVYYTTDVAQPVPHFENRLSRIRADGDRGTALEVLLALSNNFKIHNGGELVFGPDGKLYVTVGDAFMEAKAPALDFLGGKILRLETDGTGAAGNPFGGADPIRSRIWSRGHRNHVGLGFHPVTGGLYQTENGPNTGDEVNHILPGGNYGWPTCEGPCVPPDPDFIQPLHSYPQTIAPTGLGFLSPALYPPDFAGDLIFGEYNFGRLRRINLDPNIPDRILAVDEDFYELADLVPAGQEDDHRLAVLDVTSGPDGFLWFTVADFFDESGALAGIYRLRNKNAASEVPAANPWLGLFGLLLGLKWRLARGVPPRPRATRADSTLQKEIRLEIQASGQERTARLGDLPRDDDLR